MKETMGQIIRRLRKERNLTQEELAEQLNITCQAVSRWENETGMPDISMVVPLSNVLGVSTDILFGKNSTDEQEEIEAYIRENEIKLCNRPDDKDNLTWHRECCEEGRRLLEKYPNNYRLLSYLSGVIGGCLLGIYQHDKDAIGLTEEKLFWEDEFLRETGVILRYCTDIGILGDTHKWLTFYYTEKGNLSKAEEHAKQIPKLNPYAEGGYRMADLYRNLGREEECRKQYGENVLNGLTYLDMQLYRMGLAWRRVEEYEKAYSCFRLYPDLYDLMVADREDEMPFYLDPTYTLCAEMCLLLDRPDEAMEWLEKEMRHWRIVAKTFNVVTQSKLPYLYGQEMHYWAESYPKAVRALSYLAYLAEAAFDPIRETERFQAILADAQAFERGE